MDRRFLIGAVVVVGLALLIWVIMMALPKKEENKTVTLVVPSNNYYNDRVTNTPGSFYMNSGCTRIVPKDAHAVYNNTDAQSVALTGAPTNSALPAISSFYRPSSDSSYITPSLNPGKTIDYNSLMMMDDNQWTPQVIKFYNSL